MVPNPILVGTPNSSLFDGHRPQVRKEELREVQGTPRTLATRSRNASLCPLCLHRLTRKDMFKPTHGRQHPQAGRRMGSVRLPLPVTEKTPTDPEKKLQLWSSQLEPEGQHKALDHLVAK